MKLNRSHSSILGRGNTLIVSIVTALGVISNSQASEIQGDVGSATNSLNNYTIIGNLTSKISLGESNNRINALFKSLKTATPQSIVSTVENLSISTEGGKVFFATAGSEQNIQVKGNTTINSQTGNIFYTDGEGAKQLVSGEFSELVANVGGNKAGRPGFLGFGYGVGGGAGGVIYNKNGEQFIGVSKDNPGGNIKKILVISTLTGSQLDTGRGIAIGNFEAHARQMVYMPIGQIGEESNPFTVGIEDVYGKEQYVHKVGTIYATHFGIAGGTISMTSDRGDQTINSVDSIFISDSISYIAGHDWSTGDGAYIQLPSVGIYNWSDSGAIVGEERHIGTQFIGITDKIVINTSHVKESYGVYNRGGVQTIESKPGIGKSYVTIESRSTKNGAVAFSVLVNPLLDGAAFEEAVTTTNLVGNFNILAGDIVVENTTTKEDIYPTNSTLHLVPDNQGRNVLSLEDGVNLSVRLGNLDQEKKCPTTQLILGDDRTVGTENYDIALGKNSHINDQGLFRGKGKIIAKFDNESFEQAKINDVPVTDENGNSTWKFLGKGYGIVSGGILMKNVTKTLAGENSHLDVVVPITADEVPNEAFAYQIMRSAVNNLFVNDGIENIRERVDLEKWEDEKGVYEKFKYVAGKVYINEGKITGGYEEEYYFDDPEEVGNQNNIRDALDQATLRIVPVGGKITNANGDFIGYTITDRKVSLPLISNLRTSYKASYLEYVPPGTENPGETETPGNNKDDTVEGTVTTPPVTVDPDPTVPPDEPKIEPPVAGTQIDLVLKDGVLGYEKDGEFKELAVNENGQIIDANGFPLEVTVTTDNAKAIYAWEGEIGEKIFEETIKEKEPPKRPGSSSTVDTIDSITLTDYYLWRLENETLYQRMGEVRDRNDLEGGWVRILGGKNKLDKGNYYFRHKYYGIQLGFDHVVNKEEGGEWILGAGFTYTHGKTDLRNSGHGKNWLGSISLYGVRKFDNEAYLDLIVKASRIHHDYTAISNQRRYLSGGKYHTYALQASAEIGKKFMLNQEWYLDPQLQISYGRIKGAHYWTNNKINVKTSSLNSLIGRAGISLGREFKEGSTFIKVDALREFTAKHKAQYSLETGAKARSQISLKDTWGEITVGGTYNFRKDIYGFAQIKRSFASDVKQEYRADIGFRYVF